MKRKTTAIKRILATGISLTMLFSLSACNNAPQTEQTSSGTLSETSLETTSGTLSEVPVTTAATGKSTPCADNEITSLISENSLIFNAKWCRYLVTHQEYIPEDSMTCLNEHIGEYKMFKLAENNEETELTEDNIKTIAGCYGAARLHSRNALVYKFNGTHAGRACGKDC